MSEFIGQNMAEEDTVPEESKRISPEEIGSAIAAAIVHVGKNTKCGEHLIKLIAQPGVEAYDKARDLLKGPDNSTT